LKAFQKNGNDIPFQIKSDALNPEEKSIKNQQAKELRMIIDSLPQRYRNLIILRYFDELSYLEIAEQLDLPLGTVKAQMFRARDLLSNILTRRKKNTNSDF
jgi:RNA polymerase sigma factor (sigma-70 family)